MKIKNAKMMLSLFCGLLLCVPSSLGNNFESTRGSSSSPPSPSSQSTLDANKSYLQTSFNNWYPTILTTTAPPNASQVEHECPDQFVDETSVSTAETQQTSQIGSDSLHEELCPPDANLSDNSLDEGNQTAIRIASNCRTAVLQKLGQSGRQYGEKINPAANSAFRGEKRNLTNNFISPQSINAKTSPNGEITVINGKSVTGILYAHQHAPIPQFEKLTATGKNYVVTKTGSGMNGESMAASEDKAEHAENEDAEETSEESNDKEEGGADEETNIGDKDKGDKENKIVEKDVHNANNNEHSEKEQDEDEDDEGNEYSKPSPPSYSTSSTTTFKPTSASPSTTTYKSNPTTSTSTTTRPTKYRFPSRKPDYHASSKAKYGDKLGFKPPAPSPAQTSSSTTEKTSTTTRPRIPYTASTRKPLSLYTSTTPSYSRNGAPSVPMKMNTQIEALRNRYKQSNKNGGRSPLSSTGGGEASPGASPPAVSPTATPNNKVTVEYTTTTTTTTESLLKYELDHSREKEKEQSKESKEKNKYNHLQNYHHHYHQGNNGKRMQQLRGKEEKKGDEESAGKANTENPSNYNAASPTDTTKKQIPEPNNVRYQDMEMHKIQTTPRTTVRPRGLNRWTNYRNPSTPGYRYVSPTLSPLPTRVPLTENSAYFTPISTAADQNYHHQHQSNNYDNSQPFLPNHFVDDYLRKEYPTPTTPSQYSFSSLPSYQQHSTVSPTPMHISEPVSDYHFENYFTQNRPQEKPHYHLHHASPLTTPKPEVFVTIENQFIVFRNKTPIMQKEILLPPLSEQTNHHQHPHNQNKFNNNVFELPYQNVKEQQHFPSKQQHDNANVPNYNKIYNYNHGKNHHQGEVPITIKQQPKNPAEMVFYYEQNNQPKLNYKLVHSQGNHVEPSQSATSPSSLLDHFNFLQYNSRPLSNNIFTPSRPTMSMTMTKEHSHPLKLNMFKPIDITPNRATPIIYNEQMSSSKKNNHAVQPTFAPIFSSQSAQQNKGQQQRGKATSSMNFSFSPGRLAPSAVPSFEKNPNDDSEFTLVRHYVRTYDYDQNHSHQPSTFEFDNKLNVENIRDQNMQMSPSASPSQDPFTSSTSSQFYGLPRGSKQNNILQMNSDDKELYHRVRIIEPTIVAPAKPTQALVFDFNIPPGSTRQPQTDEGQSYNVNLRDVSLLTNLKRPTPSQSTPDRYQNIPLIAGKPSSSSDISAVFMHNSPDHVYSRPNIVPIETTIYESEPLHTGNLLFNENIDKPPIFTVDTKANHQLQFHSAVRQNEKSNQVSPNGRPNFDMYHPKQEEPKLQDIMDEGNAESKINEMMKPSKDPFEEYYSDRILPLNAMIDYSGVVWNSADNGRVNLLRPNTTNNRPSNDNSAADSETKSRVKSKIKDLFSIFNEVRANNQSQQQFSSSSSTADNNVPSENSKSSLEQAPQLVPVFSNTVENYGLQNDVGSKVAHYNNNNNNLEESASVQQEQTFQPQQPLLLWHLKPSVSLPEHLSTAQPTIDYRFRRNQRILNSLNSLKTIFGLSMGSQMSLPMQNSAARLYS